MVMLHTIETFEDLCNVMQRRLSNMYGDGYQRISLVFDRYDKEVSIKEMARHRRSRKETESRVYLIKPNINVPNYKKFFKNKKNKELANFVSLYLQKMVTKFWQIAKK